MISIQLVWKILIFSTESGFWVFCYSANIETAKPEWLTSLEKYSLLSSMWLEKLGKFLVEYVASVSIFYLMIMHW